MKKPFILLITLLALKTALLLLAYSGNSLVFNAIFFIWFAVFVWLAVALRASTVPKRVRYGIGAFLIVYGVSLVLFVIDTVTSYD